MNFSKLGVIGLGLLLAGCATVHQSTAPKLAGAPAVNVAAALPGPDFLPEQSATVPGTNYVVLQAAGGNLLLGPILGSMNISANSKALGEKVKDSIVKVDPAAAANMAFGTAGIAQGNGPSAMTVKPFVFMQRCYDDKFRLALVYHVENGAWVGRYNYHLPTVYAESDIGKLSEQQVAQYQAELDKAALALAGVMQKDLSGRLPDTGKVVEFGSLHLAGQKLGGMGIYTMPEELYFKNVQLVEENAEQVTIRLPGNMHATVTFGGNAFGVHVIDRKLVHTLRPAKG